MVLMQDPRGGAGAEKVISNLTLALGDEFEFVLVYPKQKRAESHIFAMRGRMRQVDLLWERHRGGVLQKAGLLVYRVRQLRGLIRSERPAVIVSNLSLVWHHLIMILKVLRLTGTPVVVRFANPPSAGWVDRGIFYRILMKLGLRAVEKVVTNSEGVKEDVLRTLGGNANNVVAIHNPIDLTEASSLSFEDISEPVFQSGRPVVLNVGRLSPQKNQRLLIRAFRRVRERIDAALVFIGEGAMEMTLRNVSRELGIHPFVNFLGWQDNPFKYMRRSTVFALSSDYEGFGNVLVEAMACGCPVVSTDCPSGPREILMGGECGILVPLGDEVALAQAIQRVLEDPGLRSRLSEKGKQAALRFERDTIATQYARVLREVAGCAS